MNPAIVVVTYNRPQSLKRLLDSIEKAVFPENVNIQLVISIDYHDSEEHKECVQIANYFIWNNGDKIVIEYKENQGLRKHILSCGDLTSKYESIIVLEDDLIVSPYFYIYSSEALSYYYDNDKIAGISLYNHKQNFMLDLPFEPLSTSSDVYFLQIASSWGQAWNVKHWEKFKNWYENSPILSDIFMPDYMKAWPESSWLKYFIGYLIENQKHFVYPKISLTTNFGDSGTHNTNVNSNFQVPFLIEYKTFIFESIEESLNIYDSFFEINPKILKRLNPKLLSYDFEVDLYGLKNIEYLKKGMILSSKKVKDKNQVNLTFGCRTKPLLSNIYLNIPGNSFALTSINNLSSSNDFYFDNPLVYFYFFNERKIWDELKLFLNIIKNKIC